MKNEIETVFPVQIENGWEARIKACENDAGNYVITELQIVCDSSLLPQEGLTSSVLRSVRLSDVLQGALSDNEYVEIELLLASIGDDSDALRREWLEEVKGTWKRNGRIANDAGLYAKTAFFYVLELRKNTRSPLQSLAQLLDVDRVTVAGRINKARELNLLTRPTKAGQSAGKSGGSLTSEAISLLEQSRKEAKK